MSGEILLVREDNGYRMLHGYLRLACLLSQADEAEAVASGEGKVRVVKTPQGILIDHGFDRVPLLADRRPLVCA
jgi:hypothetical protein